MVEPHSSNFGVITTNLLGVQIFRKFTVGASTVTCSDVQADLLCCCLHVANTGFTVEQIRRVFGDN